MRYLRTALLGGMGAYAAGCGYIYYITDGHMTPARLFLASVRSNRIGWMGVRMGWLYKFSKEPIEDVHVQCAQIMKEAFKKNGGLYIKLGQLIATVRYDHPARSSRARRVRYCF